MFTFWGTRLPAFSLQPLLDLGVYVEYILLLSRWGWIRRTLNTAPQRQNAVCSQLFCLLVQSEDSQWLCPLEENTDGQQIQLFLQRKIQGKQILQLCIFIFM